MNNKNFIFIIIILFFNLSAYSFENKILVKVDNEIITTVDIFKETQYLIAINKNIQQLSNEKIFDIAKESLVRIKIKNKEIEKYYKNINIDEAAIDNIIENNAKKLGFNSLNDFKEHLSKFDLNTEIVKNRLINEILWNKLINEKYLSKVVINKDKIKKEINLYKKNIKSYLLSEIVFNLSSGETLEKKFEKLQKQISKSGFENTALVNSISDTSSSGGRLGWVNENVLNKKIKGQIESLEESQYTKPIAISGGFLILKVEKIEEKQVKVNKQKELDKRITGETNEQLKRFSLIYFNKIKKDTKIDEL